MDGKGGEFNIKGIRKWNELSYHTDTIREWMLSCDLSFFKKQFSFWFTVQLTVNLEADQLLLKKVQFSVGSVQFNFFLPTPINRY